MTLLDEKKHRINGATMKYCAKGAICGVTAFNPNVIKSGVPTDAYHSLEKSSNSP